MPYEHSDLSVCLCIRSSVFSQDSREFLVYVLKGRQRKWKNSFAKYYEDIYVKESEIGEARSSHGGDVNVKISESKKVKDPFLHKKLMLKWM